MDAYLTSMRMAHNHQAIVMLARLATMHAMQHVELDTRSHLECGVNVSS